MTKTVMKCFAWVGLMIFSVVISMSISNFVTDLFFDNLSKSEFVEFSICVGMILMGIFMLCFHSIHMFINKDVEKPNELIPKDFLFLSLIGLVIGGLTYTTIDIVLLMSGHTINATFNFKEAIFGVLSAMSMIMIYCVTFLHGIGGTIARNNPRGGFVAGIVIAIPLAVFLFGNEIISMIGYLVSMCLMNILYARYKNIYCILFSAFVSIIFAFIMSIWLQCIILVVAIAGLVVFTMKNPQYLKLNLDKQNRL